jgi:hypothetical protein
MVCNRALHLSAHFRGNSRVLQTRTADDERARELLRKYGKGNKLDEWGRTALPITTERSTDGGQNT